MLKTALPLIVFALSFAGCSHVAQDVQKTYDLPDLPTR
jgi:hypothetical protein